MMEFTIRALRLTADGYIFVFFVLFGIVFMKRTRAFFRSVKVQCENRKINHRLTSFWSHLFVVGNKFMVVGF